MKKDLRVWIHFMSRYNGVTYFRALNICPSTHFNMGADACRRGYGAIFGQHWIQEEFPEDWLYLFDAKKIGISVLEFYPIYVLVFMFGHTIKNSNLIFHSDNQGVVDIINNQTSQSDYVMSILRPLVLLLMEYNIMLRSSHIQGLKNVLCDKISRFQVTPHLLTEYNMNPEKEPVPQEVSVSNFKLK